MSTTRRTIQLTAQESQELDRLFYQVTNSLTSSSVDELETFTDLFVRSLSGKGDSLFANGESLTRKPTATLVCRNVGSPSDLEHFSPR